MIVLVEAPAGRVVRLGNRHLAFDQAAHDGFVIGLAPAVGVADRLRHDAKMARPLHQQFADHQGAGGLLPGCDRLCRRMMLHFAHNRVAGDRNAVDADRRRLSCRDLRVRGASRHRPTPPVRARASPRAHHLIAAPADIPDRRAPDVHQAGEREDQEDRHAEREVHLEEQRYAEDQRGNARLQQQDALRPGHEGHHHVAVEMLQRDSDGGEAERELDIEDQQDRDIAERRGGADARVEQPAMHQQRNADETHDAGNAADADRHPLLEGVRNAERLEDPDRRQQAAEMAEEDDQDADMEQIGAPGQLPAAQQLARSAAPGVLLAVEAQHAAEQEHGQAEIGIPAEDDVIDQIAHDRFLIGAAE